MSSLQERVNNCEDLTLDELVEYTWGCNLCFNDYYSQVAKNLEILNEIRQTMVHYDPSVDDGDKLYQFGQICSDINWILADL